ncbi:MAG: hypothetical protein ABR990_00370 [Terracidiphilus sp.]|jgi:hypothetical protein
MKKALIITSLCVLGLSLVIFFAIKEISHYARVNGNLRWGPESRLVKVLSVDAVPFNVFYGSDGGDSGNLGTENSAHHYYRAKALDVVSGANLRWKLSCDQEIKPPAAMTYTPYGYASGPRLEIHAVVGGPYLDEQQAAASRGGTIPADEMMMHSSSALAASSAPDSVYVLQRASIVAGNDFRTADPATNAYSGQRMVDFTLINDAGDKFYDYTSKNVGHSMAVVMGGRIREVAAIRGPIRNRGEIAGSFTQDEVAALSKILRADALGKHRADNYGSLASRDIYNTQNNCSVSADDSFDFLDWITR